MTTDGVAALQARESSGRDGWLVAGLLAAITVVSLLVEDHVTVTSLAMLYVLGVVIVSYSAGRAAALVCSFASVALLNFFFIPPRYAFHVEADENVSVLVAMLVVALVISERGTALQREAAAARLNAARARQLQELATELADTTDADEVARTGERFLQAPVVQGGASRDASAVKHAEAIEFLLAQALRRLKLTASMHAAQESAQWHRAQSTFLAAISHDFRTPLAAIVTAASSLQDQRDKLGPAEREHLTRILLDEAAHLGTLTENTLQLARLENAGEIHRDWQSIEEIVGSVVARLRQRDRGGRIHAHVPSGLPLIQGDPVLLAQLVDNLLDNALKYSDGEVDLSAHAEEGWLELAVHDRGPGVPPEDEERVFEPYRRGGSAGQRGAGLGLAVCRAIARAHGGELLLRRREGGGSSFVLRLPVVPLP